MHIAFSCGMDIDQDRKHIRTALQKSANSLLVGMVNTTGYEVVKRQWFGVPSSVLSAKRDAGATSRVVPNKDIGRTHVVSFFLGIQALRQCYGGSAQVNPKKQARRNRAFTQDVSIDEPWVYPTSHSMLVLS